MMLIKKLTTRQFLNKKVCGLFFILLIHQGSIAQCDTFYIPDCRKIHESKISSERIRYRVVDTCDGYSYISEKLGEPMRGQFLDGFYCEYWDTAFTKVKIQGNFSYGIPVGIWQEYYPNGMMLSEGMCNKLSLFGVFNRDMSALVKIKAVNETQPDDTLLVEPTKFALDSLRDLKLYAGKHSFDVSGGNLIQSNLGFPSARSLKTGKWVYYNSVGDTIRIEYYHMGVLFKSFPDESPPP